MIQPLIKRLFLVDQLDRTQACFNAVCARVKNGPQSYIPVLRSENSTFLTSGFASIFLPSTSVSLGYFIPSGEFLQKVLSA
ncbi:hypothetical protein O181_059704 [Austropuccinia psidii MF-1]|uniref:Uncharacterized protein n=1 Tax=Austropuccinia psidii MF-1 TaxID=1389203 RepID=A0A9Q3EES7_9BASI|nr:hypothetical protein [Austropuccinia psidii MF-1]